MLRHRYRACADVDITIRTPVIQAIQARMESRFNLRYASISIRSAGFAGDGTIVVRDASKLALQDRVAVNAAVAD